MEKYTDKNRVDSDFLSFFSKVSNLYADNNNEEKVIEIKNNITGISF